MLVMVNKYLTAIITISIINNTFAMQDQDNKYKKETVLGRLVTNCPFSVLSGGYLIVKDAVHRQLGTYTPYVFIKEEEGRTIFPTPSFHLGHITQNTLIAQHGRYRNVGFALLLTAIVRNISYSKDGDMIKIDFMKQ